MENFIFYAVNGAQSSIFGMVNHSVKSAQIRSFFWPVFSHIRTEFFRMREYGPEKTPYLDNFHAVNMPLFLKQNIIISFNTFQPEDGIFNDKVK